MVSKFREEYTKLNSAQKQAVDIIDGPLLVIAGPGTGKTQLLSVRVANVMNKTDTDPANILCLTFTDNAARNMRERLESIVGQSAYHIAIHTFHSFGSEIINQFPDYFTKRQLLQQVDELGRYELLRDIFDNLAHSNPLSVKVGDNFIHIKDTLNTISWLKANGLRPIDLHSLIAANQKFINEMDGELSNTFSLPPSPKQLGTYQKLLDSIKKRSTGKSYFGFPEYASECASELESAIEATDKNARYAPKITAWRNSWCQKNAEGKHVFKDGGKNIRKMHALANVYQELLDEMTRQGLYDFDDMIMEVLGVIESSSELRFNLQERYQYILIDEFQDTNKAQLRLIYSLGDNPINEGRPNIMAVGDDDQAIYAFQGAQVSNLVSFIRKYKIKPIVLDENYRSTSQILESSFTVANQLTDKLSSVISGANKQLTAMVKYPSQTLQHPVFVSELAQYEWIAKTVQEYIKLGKRPEEIAIIAPRHRYLERLMPYLGQLKIPVAYERRENILDAPIIKQLLTMAQLVVAIAENNQAEVDTLIAQVISYDFWGFNPEALIDISLYCYDHHQHWLPVLAKYQDTNIAALAKWFVKLAKQSYLEPMEYILDELVGSLPESLDAEFDELVLLVTKTSFVSPMKAYYFSDKNFELATDSYLTLLGQLSSLRHSLRQWKPGRTLFVKDLIEFINLHKQADLKIIDTNPHTQTTNAVQVMTAYKAKGLEFEVVFVVNAQDEIWGPTARHRLSSITLPHNLPITPAGDSNNDKLRLLFVALTRAKHSLHIASYTNDLDNRPSPLLSFLGDLPIVSIKKPARAQAVEILATDWAYRYRQIIADKQTLLEPLLKNYKLSVTHLNNFLDIVNSGPKYFLVHNLLRFPEALTPSAAYGDTVHRTLQWAHLELKNNGKQPSIQKIQTYFQDQLKLKHLRLTDFKKFEKRGVEALNTYFEQRGSTISAKDLVERGFNNEGIVINGAKLSGKIDKLHFSTAGQVSVIDFKTGKPAESWQGRDNYEKIKLHKYRQQLLFYKLLVENSASFHGKLNVYDGALEFVEPNEQKKLVANLELAFDKEELERFIKLIGAIWQHIIALNFPIADQYPKNLKGILQFEHDLIEGKI